MKTHEDEYYSKVAKYYDDDAEDFEKRYEHNSTLQKIRTDFRKISCRFASGKNWLEIGVGPGLDVRYFANTFPTSNVFGVDVSSEMIQIARKNNSDLHNVRLEVATVEDIKSLVNDQKFDVIYVYFGALNTVVNLKESAIMLNELLEEKGTVILTFANKYYLIGILISLLKLNFKAAFARIKPVWGGYSPTKFLASKCYSPGQIEEAFSLFEVKYRKGYSILYPAWFYDKHSKRFPRTLQLLWKIDALINKSFLWSFGEYTLYVFEKKK